MIVMSVDPVVTSTVDDPTLSERIADAGWWAVLGVAVYFVLTALVAIAISKKAGYSGWWGFFAVAVPVIGPILVLIFALLKWPSLRERDEAVGLLAANGIALPSKAGAAAKESTRLAQVEEQARQRVEARKVEGTPKAGDQE
jgi:hypothetical protein